MDKCKPVPTPVGEGEIESDGEIEYYGEEKSNYPYREAVGSLLYLSTRTRPDIAFAVSKASRCMENPEKKDIIAIKRIFRYLSGTLEEGLCYKFGSDLKLTAFCDSDYASDLKTRRSTTGYVLMMSGGPISWCSRRQPIVSLSSTEAEFISAAEYCKEAMFIKSLLKDLNIDIKLSFHIDNQSAIALIKNGVFNKKSKHIDSLETSKKRALRCLVAF
ncbi:uncharacterized protein LOC128201101 [Galleria mellonella]|uniref:Uncharacterized protein LOC128201101 n=1 Tax=Galleria mellonella TaxID=7137 RepID=A0ABM3MN39_GALME|nr:uncharacterized protein LOC128201101 [Galleria mellonella]